MSKLLVLMAKQPLVGKSKTRMIPFLSADQAAQLSHCFLQDKVDQMRAVTDVQRAISYYPQTAHHFFAALAPDFLRMPQVGGNLSQRLKHVFRNGFEQGYTQVVAIDSDSATLPPQYLQEAFTTLSEHDVSLGPCEDGGYYALGMTAPHLSLLDVQMSTPHVFQNTLQIAQESGLSIYQLPLWYDVDRPHDLQRLNNDLKGHNTATARYLTTLTLNLNGD